MNNYCNFCCNATVEPELTSDNDLGFFGIGSTAEGYHMYIRSGAGKPTAILVSKCEKIYGCNVDIGLYEMKYCPECGRKLIENKYKRK